MNQPNANFDVVSSCSGALESSRTPHSESPAHTGVAQGDLEGIYSTPAAQDQGGMAPEFDKLLQEHAGLLARIVASYEADPALREDLFQEIAVALWRALPAWRSNASVKTFMARVAHNRCVTHIIHSTRHKGETALPESLYDPGYGPEGYAQLAQKAQRLQSAVRALPLALRMTVTLALEGFSHQEIGETLGVTTNNVDVRLNRARNALKVMLGEST